MNAAQPDPGAILQTAFSFWSSQEKKMHLIRAACDALPPGGALVAIRALIDDARRAAVAYN